MIKTSQSIKAYQCPQQGAPLSPITYQPTSMGPHDIRVKITHCGICHADLHLIQNDWNSSKYPLVPGHEIIGFVEAKGDLVHHLAQGERIGIGWQGKSCMSCEWCLEGKENFCPTREATCVSKFGGFAEEIIADGRFAFPIPENLPSQFAAPLMCGGVTVFTPFIEHRVSATMHVGVVGIGGLGHLALKFAKAFGCEVTAFSTTKEKEKEANQFGADHFIHTTNPEIFETIKGTFDLILFSSTKGLEWKNYLSALRPQGKLCLIGALEENIDTPITSLVSGMKSLCGSNIGSRPVIKKMLHFADRHHIYPQIEEFSMDRVNDALEKLKKGAIRYRAVLFT